MSSNKEVNDRIPDQSLWSNNSLLQQITSNNCAEQRGGRTLCNQHSSTKALHLNNFQKEVLNMKKINIRIHTDSSNTNCVVKESETH